MSGFGDARILDRGYRRYDGDRRGTRGALRTLTWHSLQRALGMRRSFWAKVLPLMMIVVSYVPAIVFVGIVALFPKARDLEGQSGLQLPTYGEYFGFIASALVLFVAFVGPELLCTDRRTGMLGLYLASPLTRDTYVLAKALATLIVLSTITVGPPLFMLVASVLQGVGPDGPAGVAGTLARIVGAGLAVAAMFTAISLGISSLTDRKAFATAATLLLFLVTGVVAGVLEASGLGEDFFLINVLRVPFELVVRIHGERGGEAAISTAAIVVTALAWTVVGVLITRTRYQKLMVTR